MITIDSREIEQVELVKYLGLDKHKTGKIMYKCMI